MNYYHLNYFGADCFISSIMLFIFQSKINGLAYLAAE